jgi:alpha/beta superfamily hydrolase
MTGEHAIRFAAGAIELEGLVAIPARAAAGVVVCHPHPLYGGDMHNNVTAALTEAFIAAGIATLRFNFRGVGGSDGQHDNGRGEVEDVTAAVTALLSRAEFTQVAVAGYSFGSWVGMTAGAGDRRVHKLIGVAPPVASRDFLFLAATDKPKLLIAGDRDDHAPLARLEPLLQSLTEPKALTVVPGADHFFRGLEPAISRAAVAFLTA